MVIIHPYSRKLNNGQENPKNYPFWRELIGMIDEDIVQIGVVGEKALVADFRESLTIAELKLLVQECRTWIAVDSFFQHLCWTEKKPGIVLWSVSDPLIFGHPENTNLLKSRDCLATNQFLWWESIEFDPSKFVRPEEVLPHL